MEVDTIIDIVQNLDESPLDSWGLIYKIRSSLEKKDLDAACCFRMARSILPTLGLLRDHHELDDEEVDEVLLGMQFFVANHMDSVNSTEGPGIVFDCLEELYKNSPRTSRFIDLISELQNTIVDHFVRTPESQPPSQNRKIVNFWINAIIYATETSKFDVASAQVSTLCRSIGDTFFAGTKLGSVLKKLADMKKCTADKTRTDFPYLFDFEIAALVKRYASEHGASTGYTFLWAVLEAFLLRMKSEPDYLNILKFIVHLLQAIGVPIKCMATPSLLEYPQVELSEGDRLVHLMKILEIYVASNLHHPSVLVKTDKRINGRLIFVDITQYILKHEVNGTTEWYNALRNLGTISPSIITTKLRMILLYAWFNCDAEDLEAQDGLIMYLIDLFDKMNRSADFYNRLPGAINDFLEKPRDQPRLSEAVLACMRRSFARLGSDDVITIWSNYIKYFQQVISKWRDNPDGLSEMPQLFTLKIFTEFIQHCPLVPMVQLNQEQHETMDAAIQSTMTLTTILQEVMDALPDRTKELRSTFFKVSQNFIKTCFARRCYLQNTFHHAFEEASIRQNDLVQRFEANHKALRKNKRLKLDLICYGAKFSEKPREEANECLLHVCENFNTLDWQVRLINNPHVLRSASKKQIDVFINLIYETIRDQEGNANMKHSTYLRSQVFRDCQRQVLSFVKLVSQDLVAELVEIDRVFGVVFDVDDAGDPVKWTELIDLLERLKPKTLSKAAVQKANEMLAYVPVQSLPASTRLMFLGLFVSFAVIVKHPSEEFFDACFHYLADWSSALKFKEDTNEDSHEIQVSICRLAALCLERVLSIDPQLEMSRGSVRAIVDLIRYNVYTTAKTAEPVDLFESIISRLSPKNEAQLCTILCLVETITRVHSKNISPEDLAKIKSRCQQLVTKQLKRTGSELENVIFVTSKYAEVFGTEEVCRLKCFPAAIESATESVRLSKPDRAAFLLFLKAGDLSDVINSFFALRAILVVGKEFLDELHRQLDSPLSEKLWPLLEETWDTKGALRAAPLFNLSLGDEVDPLPEPVPDRDVLCERFLEVTLALVKHMSQPNLIKLVVQIHRLIAVQTLYDSFRVDLCCSILDAIVRKHASPELIHTVQAVFGSIPWERLNGMPVDQWCTMMSITAEIYCRAFAFKPNYKNGSAPILLGNTGKLIEAVVKRCDGHCGKGNVPEIAAIVRVIDSINRLLLVLNRRKAKDHTRSIETVGPFLVAAYLRAIAASSVHETFRPDLKAMAFLALGLCNPKSLLSLKLETPKTEQEVLRRLVEECRTKFR